MIRDVSDKRLKKAAILICSVDDIWEFVHGDMRGRLQRYISKMHYRDYDPALVLALDHDGLKEYAQRKIDGIGPVRFRKLLLLEHFRRSEFLDRALSLYKTCSTSFDAANKWGPALISPLAGTFHKGDVSALLKIASTNIQIKHSFSLGDVIKRVRDAKIMTNVRFDRLLRSYELVQQCPWVEEKPKKKVSRKAKKKQKS